MFHNAVYGTLDYETWIKNSEYELWNSKLNYSIYFSKITIIFSINFF